MKFFSFVRLLFILLSVVAISMLIPLAVAFAYGEVGVYVPFLIPILSCISLGIIFYFIGKNQKIKLSIRSGFAIVAIFWICASFLGSLPIYLSGFAKSFTDAFFESVSGFSTTGATIFSDVEILPRSINLWRCQMHWLGGMGIVVLTVALMPILGVGGFKLIKAETTGPEKDKITPKITVTAKILWIIYVSFTAAQTILLMFAGMDFVDALSHAFSTLGTGGFSTKNSSIGFYNSDAIQWICTAFMIFSAVNFSLYFKLFTGNAKELITNTEFKAFLGILFTSIFIVTLAILPQYQNFFTSFRYSAFHVASIMSTTGFATQNYLEWVSLAQIILFFLMFVGGSSGSTSGGVKVIRWVILAKQSTNETLKMLHPHGIFSIRINGRAGRNDVVYNVSAFFFLYALLVLITTIITSIGGSDILTSFTASLSVVGNIGPGFGKIGPMDNFAQFAPAIKWWYCFAMLAGRLELYTMIIFFNKAFWKK